MRLNIHTYTYNWSSCDKAQLEKKNSKEHPGLNLAINCQVDRLRVYSGILSTGDMCDLHVFSCAVS